MSGQTLDALVLAGDRGRADPLAVHAAKPGKALVPVAGESMLSRVVRAVAGMRDIERIVVACPDREDYLAALDSGHGVSRIDPRGGPAASVAAGLQSLGPVRPVLVVTADHPLLRSEWLDDFAARARATGADAVVGVVAHEQVIARFPGHRRTRYRFADGPVCGTNLFWFSGPRAAAVAEIWRDFEADRKTPWKIVARLGIANLLKYLAGRLTLDAAAQTLSRKLGVRVAAVRIDEPAAAVDVDTIADLELVESLVSGAEAERA